MTPLGLEVVFLACVKSTEVGRSEGVLSYSRGGVRCGWCVFVDLAVGVVCVDLDGGLVGARSGSVGGDAEGGDRL